MGAAFCERGKIALKKLSPQNSLDLEGAKTPAAVALCHAIKMYVHVTTVYQNVKHPFYWLRLHLIIFYSYTCFPSISCVYNCTTVGVG